MKEYVSFGMVSVVLVLLYSSGCGSSAGPAGLVGLAGAGGVWPTGVLPNPGPTVAVRTDVDDEELAFLELINAHRAQAGIGPVQLSQTLSRASDWLSTDMAERAYFSHTDSQGRDPFTRIEDFGYGNASAMGENIAAGNSGAQGTFTQWKNSPGHNANMLDSSYRAIGIGRYYKAGSPYGWYWTTDFGNVVQ